MNQPLFIPADVVSSYSRAQALGDGLLVAVSDELRQEVGFRIPMAMTSRVFDDCVAWSVDDTERKQVSQDQDARLRDLLACARYAAHCDPQCSTLAFDLARVPRTGSGILPRRVQLVLSIHPGDKGEPVLTIMFPDED
jgi:hypothetical protein